MNVAAAVSDGDAVDKIVKRILKIAEWKVFGNLSVEKVIINGKWDREKFFPLHFFFWRLIIWLGVVNFSANWAFARTPIL